MGSLAQNLRSGKAFKSEDLHRTVLKRGYLRKIKGLAKRLAGQLLRKSVLKSDYLRKNQESMKAFFAALWSMKATPVAAPSLAPLVAFYAKYAAVIGIVVKAMGLFWVAVLAVVVAIMGIHCLVTSIRFSIWLLGTIIWAVACSVIDMVCFILEASPGHKLGCNDANDSEGRLLE
ncbi:hypothetical protein V491_00850 [Pseudogymnoascus sp. VKM F-3775]|nr:hypothetical protein V491_00850 [Pseudogymnoascus sp. VKM F-3775]